MKKSMKINYLLIIFASSLFGSYHIYYYCLNEINNKNVDNYLKEEVILENNPPLAVGKVNNIKEEYLGVLIIPKINLQKEFYSVDSKENNVNKNLQLLKGSDLSFENGNIIFLAAHSGESYLGYFKNLKELEVNDEIKLFLRNKEYYYTINKIYEIEKNGKININKNINDNILVLTTCSKNKNKQLIIEAKLIKNSL